MRLKTISLQAGFLLASTLSGGGSPWLSPQWDLSSQLSGTAGYDSNLTANKNGEGAGFIAAEPRVVLQRTLSATKLEFTAAMTATRFFNGNNDAQVDPAFGVEFAYPHTDNEFPTVTGALSWNQTTMENASVGARLEAAHSSADFTARLWSTGKFGVNTQLSYEGIDYRNAGFADNQRGSITLGAAFEPQPLVEFSVNLISLYGEADAFAPLTERTRNWEEGLTLRLRGQISSKVAGSIYAGAAVIRYRGGFQRSFALPIGGGELGWQATARGWLYANLEFGADYSPTGEALEIQRLALRYEQTIQGPWKMEFQVSPARMRYSRETTDRVDRAVGSALAFAYEPSNRFSVRFSYAFTHQNSETSFANFDRHLLTTRVSLRF